MQSGRLRSRVTLQTPVATRNEFGEEIVTWTDQAELWADIHPISARERYLNSADQTQAAADHWFGIRWRNDIQATRRIVFGTRIFDIEGSVDPDSKRRRLRLTCREVLA